MKQNKGSYRLYLTEEAVQAKKTLEEKNIDLQKLLRSMLIAEAKRLST